LLWTVAILAALLTGLGLLLYRGTQHVPAFYEQALSPKLTPREQTVLSDDFEHDVLELHNDAGKLGGWEAVFTDEQINAWLATDLPRDHPRALPDDMREPRVNITPELARVACRYRHESLETVLSLEAEIHLTDKPNQVAVRIRSVRAGWVPLPVGSLVKQATEAARRKGVELVWSQQDGDPVALFTISARHEQSPNREVYVDTLELRDGEIRLAGHTERRE
jgi:hypothetical protein